MNRLKALFVVMMSLLMAQKINGLLIEVQPDVYMERPSQAIIDVVQEAAEKIGFTQKYEVMVPTKAGMAINPWNKFIAYSVNPVSKLPILIINQEWFSSLEREQQLFLVARCFFRHIHGYSSTSMKIIPLIFSLFSILLYLLLLWLLSKTGMRSKSIWMRIVLVWLIVGSMNIFFFNGQQSKLLTYMGQSHDHLISSLALENICDRETAIKSLEAIDRAIKADLAAGELFFAPHKDLFAQSAQALKQ